MEKTAFTPLTAMKTIPRCQLNHTNGDVIVIIELPHIFARSKRSIIVSV